VEITTYDTRGRLVAEDTRELLAGLHRFDAPPSGLVRIREVGS